MTQVEQILIRPERASDRDRIETVHRAAFEGEAEAALVRALRELPAFDRELSLVAEDNGRVVGHLLLTPARLASPEGERAVMILGPEAVLPSQSHRGIGARLLREALDRAAAWGAVAVVETGRPEYFRAHGFVPATEKGVKVSLPVDEILVSVYELTPGGLAGGGVVSFPEPFHRLFGAHR